MSFSAVTLGVASVRATGLGHIWSLILSLIFDGLKPQHYFDASVTPQTRRPSWKYYSSSTLYEFYLNEHRKRNLEALVINIVHQSWTRLI